MSINRPLQRAIRTASALPAFTHSVRPRVRFPVRADAPRRSIFGFLRRNREEPILDPMSEKYSRQKQKSNALSESSAQRGSIASGSILDDGEPSKPQGGEGGEESAATGGTSLSSRDPTLMARVLDPSPKARKTIQRKLVIKDIRKRGRINKATLLARTERQYLAKSHFIKTSIKKLMLLARQISGKPLDEAIVQMRFSKKKAAQEVLQHLERARDEAVVSRGMNLGSLNKSEGGEENSTGRMVVQDKKGKRRLVTDATSMYVDQAWVGRGTPDYGTDFRARGRAFRLTKPYTSISVLLKEEKTRIRRMNERADKEAAKKPWVHLPDRPVTRQTQFPLW